MIFVINSICFCCKCDIFDFVLTGYLVGYLLKDCSGLFVKFPKRKTNNSRRGDALNQRENILTCMYQRGVLYCATNFIDWRVYNVFSGCKPSIPCKNIP